MQLMLRSAAAAWRRNAFVLGSCLTGAKTCVADILVQKTYEGRETIDWKRNFVFSSFGLLYLGAFQCAASCSRARVRSRTCISSTFAVRLTCRPCA